MLVHWVSCTMSLLILVATFVFLLVSQLYPFIAATCWFVLALGGGEGCHGKKWCQYTPFVLTCYVSAESQGGEGRPQQKPAGGRGRMKDMFPGASAHSDLRVTCCSERQLSLTVQSSWTYLANHHNKSPVDIFCSTTYPAGWWSAPAPATDTTRFKPTGISKH